MTNVKCKRSNGFIKKRNVQAIPVNQGQPFIECINTGSNGICNTDATGDDAQYIVLNRGKPNATCISPGSNGFRDTSSTSGDDQISGDYINTGNDGVCNTTADNTDTLTDSYSASALQAYLNNTVYNQAVVNWTVTQVSEIDWNWDLNRDGKLDATNPTTWSNEELAIINNCDPDPQKTTYDKIVFFVNNPDPTMCGSTFSGARWAFVYPDVTTDEDCTAAHELGHSTFELIDLGPPPASNDTDNLMWYNDAYGGERLRKGQWTTIQNKK